MSTQQIDKEHIRVDIINTGWHKRNKIVTSSKQKKNMSPNITIITLCNLVNCRDLDYQYFQILYTQKYHENNDFKK